MTAIAADRFPRRADEEHRRRNRDTMPSFLAAVAMHGTLVAALWLGIRWHTGAGAPVTAELWNLPPMPIPHAVHTPTPPKVTPEPPAPPPPPKEERLSSKADIVEKKTAPTTPKPPPEKKRRNRHAQAKAEAEAEAEERARLEKAAEQQVQQEMQSLTHMADRTATAAPRSATVSSSGMSNADANLIGAAIKAHLFFAVPPDVSDSVYAEFEVHVLPSGEQVDQPRLIKSSGLPGFDEAALRAILNVNPFPRKDGRDLPRTVDVKLYPKDAR